MYVRTGAAITIRIIDTIEFIKQNSKYLGT